MRLCVLSATCPLNFTFVVPRNATSALWYADNILSLTPNPNPDPDPNPNPNPNTSAERQRRLAFLKRIR